MDPKWKKMGGDMYPTWDYQNLKPNAQGERKIEGVFIEMQTDVGPNHSNMYVVELSDGFELTHNSKVEQKVFKAGDIVGIWGSTLIDTRLKNLQPGEEVLVLYLGMAKSPKTGRQYHNFEIYHAPKDEEDVNRGSDAATEDLSDLPWEKPEA